MNVERSHEIIAVVDGVCGGRPVIKGTRIEPRHLSAYAISRDVDGVLADYPGLSRQQILAAFDYLEG